MIKLDSVTKQYHYCNDKVLDNLSIDIDSGLATLLVDVQSGKSTITKLLLGLEKCDSGSITVLGNQPGANHDIALLDGSLLLWDNKSVLYNLMYPLLVRKVPKKQARAIAKEQAVKFNLDDIMHKRVCKLEHDRLLDLVVARATIRPLKLVIVDMLDSVCNITQWNWAIDALTTHCSNVLVLTSNSKRAVGTVYVVHNNQLVHVGSRDSAMQVCVDNIWLFNMIGEYCE